jgi:hypothetical protein
MFMDAQLGQDSCAGKVTTPHALQRLPISCGPSFPEVKMPSAIGTAAISVCDNAILTKEGQS